jgi:hypothetical protein
MAERQQKLLASRIAGRPELSEQATDDGKRTEAGSSVTERCSSRREPGVHIHGRWLWIPGSLAIAPKSGLPDLGIDCRSRVNPRSVAPE